LATREVLKSLLAYRKIPIRVLMKHTPAPALK